jgi:hypothetical protein
VEVGETYLLAEALDQLPGLPARETAASRAVGDRRATTSSVGSGGSTDYKAFRIRLLVAVQVASLDVRTVVFPAFAFLFRMSSSHPTYSAGLSLHAQLFLPLPDCSFGVLLLLTLALYGGSLLSRVPVWRAAARCRVTSAATSGYRSEQGEYHHKCRKPHHGLFIGSAAGMPQMASIDPMSKSFSHDVPAVHPFTRHPRRKAGVRAHHQQGDRLTSHFGNTALDAQRLAVRIQEAHRS